jgi:hypothetical protein
MLVTTVALPAATAAASSNARGRDPAASADAAGKRRQAAEVRRLRRRVARARTRALRAAHRLGLRPHGGRAERHTRDTAYLHWLLRRWQRRGRRWRREIRHQLDAPPGVISGLMCIHRHEGAMSSVNPAGPYYGGWQLDASFERAYGRRMLRKYGGRHADRWRPRDQLVVALNGYRHRGWSPWPSTAPLCGL